MKGGLALTAIGIIALIVLSAGVIAFVIDPAGMLALGNQVSQGAYKATGGYIGTPPPPPPPVSFNVGEEVLFNGNTKYITGNDTGAWGTLGVGWNATQPIGGGLFTWFGSCKVPTELYALNITNNANVPITKIIIYVPGGFGTNAPLPTPWYTNSTFYSPSSEGNVTSWQITNVNIPPHSTVVVWNASSLAPTVPIWFYFANGSVYATKIPWTPNYPE